MERLVSPRLFILFVKFAMRTVSLVEKHGNMQVRTTYSNIFSEFETFLERVRRKTQTVSHISCKKSN